MTVRTMAIAAAAAVVMGLAAPAAAQVTTTSAQAAPYLEFAVGYQVLHRGGDNSSTYPLGVAFDGGRYWGPYGLVAEVGWSRDSTDVPGISVSSNYLHVAGGGRFLIVRDARIRPHLQVLGGISRATFSSETEVPGGLPIEVEGSDTAFMLQPGIGVTFATSEAVGFAFALDYRRAFFDEGAGLAFGDTNEIRFFFGVRFSIE